MLFVNASVLGRSLRLHSPAATCLKSIRFYSDDENVTKLPDKETREAKKDVAKKKLNQLLEMMVKEEVVHAKAKLELARPRNKRSEGRVAKEIESVTRKSVDNKIIAAVKEVAAAVVGDVKQTESELLTKLLNSTKPEQTSETPASLSDIVRGMKIDRTEKPEAVSRAQQVRELLGAVKEQPQVQQSRRPPRLRKRELSDIQTPVVPIDLFGADPLGIFTRDGGITSTVSTDASKRLSTWDMLLERDLRLAVTHPPSNYFQQMIQWTDQGKLWKFPIDNEQGMDEEHSIYFTEHVFLEQQLEPWCPPRGPIRQFMQLVCVGMSKNPYMRASTKRGHIEWYRDYFTERRQLLEDLGAISASNAPGETKEHGPDADSSCSKSL